MSAIKQSITCRVLLTFVCSVVLAGCPSTHGTVKAYHGTQLSNTEISIIKPDKNTGAIVRIYSINGYNTSKGRDYRTFPSEVHVHPGKHTVTAQIGCCGFAIEFWNWGVVTNETKAAETYIVSGGVKNNKRMIWVIHQGSGEIVAESELRLVP